MHGVPRAGVGGGGDDGRGHERGQGGRDEVADVPAATRPVQLGQDGQQEDDDEEGLEGGHGVAEPQLRQVTERGRDGHRGGPRDAARAGTDPDRAPLPADAPGRGQPEAGEQRPVEREPHHLVRPDRPPQPPERRQPVTADLQQVAHRVRDRRGSGHEQHPRGGHRDEASARRQGHDPGTGALHPYDSDGEGKGERRCQLRARTTPMAVAAPRTAAHADDRLSRRAIPAAAARTRASTGTEL